MHATLWLDLRDQFVEEHVEEWEAQKCRMGALNDLERDTEVVYRARIMKRQEDKAIANSKEAATKELLPEQQVARAERQASATPTKADMTSTSTGAALYPDWIMRSKTKPTGRDMPRPYQAPREDTDRDLTLEEELDAASIFDPLQLASQSNQPDTQHYSTPDTTAGAEGPRTPPHYSDTPAIVPAFDLAQVGILPKMSPVTDQENELLNLALGSPVMRTAPPGLSQGRSRSGHSSCSGSPMSLGSQAGMSLALALKVCTRPVTPVMFGSSSREEPPKYGDEEDMDAAEDDAAEDDAKEEED